MRVSHITKSEGLEYIYKTILVYLVMRGNFYNQENEVKTMLNELIGGRYCFNIREVKTIRDYHDELFLSHGGKKTHKEIERIMEEDEVLAQMQSNFVDEFDDDLNPRAADVLFNINLGMAKITWALTNRGTPRTQAEIMGMVMAEFLIVMSKVNEDNIADKFNLYITNHLLKGDRDNIRKYREKWMSPPPVGKGK